MNFIFSGILSALFVSFPVWASTTSSGVAATAHARDARPKVARKVVKPGQNSKSQAGWEYGSTRGEPNLGSDNEMCHRIFDELTTVAPTWRYESKNYYLNYDSAALLNSPMFSSPPWTKLVASEHVGLISRLFRYAAERNIYFQPAWVHRATQYERRYREVAEKFIADGGSIHHWRVRLFEYIYPADTFAPSASAPGEQDIVELRSEMKCPDTSCAPGLWKSKTFLVTPDLKSPAEINMLELPDSTIMRLGDRLMQLQINMKGVDISVLADGSFELTCLFRQPGSSAQGNYDY
jgi:hypothetical protein